MRNPNGYGCIKKLSGNRRRPWAFVISADGRQKVIDYFETQVEARIYQADYAKSHNRRPLSDKKMTLLELYYRWLPVHRMRTEPSKSTLDGYRAALSHCRILHDKPLSEIRYADLQGVLDGMERDGLSQSSRKKVRSLITLMFRHAERMEYCQQSYARLLSIGKHRPVRPHMVMSRQKINRLWSIADQPMVDTILILLYTGMRVGELLTLHKSDVNRRQRYIRIQHAKTAAGIRIIPIHPRIWPLVEHRLSMTDDWLISQDGQPYTYSQYRTCWDAIMRQIRGAKHRPHDTRHTVATLLNNAGVNETVIKRILGHAGKDVTQAVYTHTALRQLRKGIQALP